MSHPDPHIYFTVLILCSALVQTQAVPVPIVHHVGNIWPVRSSTLYTCFSNTGDLRSIQWLLNGTRLEDLNLEDIRATSYIGMSLQIDRVPLKYNNTVIQCIATFTTGDIVSTENNTLLVQGRHTAVTSLTATPIPENSTIFLTWTPPFALDVPGDIDITYCVDVVNSTSSLVVHSECGNIFDNYTVLFSPDNIVCDIYIFIITPVNSAGNGTSANVTQRLSIYTIEPELEDVYIAILMDGSRLTVIVSNVSAPVCSGSVILQDIYDSSYRLGPIEVAPDNQDNSTGFIISAEDDLNRLFYATFTLTNVVGSARSNINISTHDIKNIGVSSRLQQGQNEVDIATEYFNHSSAVGAFIIIIFTEDDGSINFTRSVYLSLDKETSLNYTLPFDLYPGDYQVYVYDIEDNGRLSVGVNYPASTDMLRLSVMVYSQGSSIPPQSSDIESCTVTRDDRVITASCNYTTTSTATGFLMVAQSNTTVDRLNVNMSTDRSTPVTVQVENGTYFITFFPLNGDGGIVNSIAFSEIIMLLLRDVRPTTLAKKNTPLIIGGSVIGLISIAIVIAIILIQIIVLILYRRRRS